MPAETTKKLCLVCYLDTVADTCPTCDHPLVACAECAADMGENYCPACDADVD